MIKGVNLLILWAVQRAVQALNNLDRNERYNYPFRWGVDVFSDLGGAEAERRAEEHAVQLRVSSWILQSFRLIYKDLRAI